MKKLLLFLATCLILVIVLTAKNKTETPVQQTPAQRLYNSITNYAQLYGIPLHIAFNIARIETGYLGPHHTDYNHKQKSSAGALGAMQIMPQYASYYAGFTVPKSMLRDSIELNVEISMKMLQEWYKRYKDWGKVAGAYNTGKPVMNKYAHKAIKHNYLDFWMKPDMGSYFGDTLMVVNFDNANR